MIGAGSLNNKITFQPRTETSDGLGPGGTVTWSDNGAVTTKGAIWPLKAAERIEGMRTKHNITHRIRVRYRSSIVPTMRIKYYRNGVTRYFEIVSIINIGERNRVLEILAEEKS